MKKIIPLALVLLLCLTLCACDNNEKEIEAATAPAATLAILEEVTAVTDPEELDETALKQLCGEWKTLMREDVDRIESITIYEDGTLLIDDSTFAWKYMDDNSGMITLSVFNGEEKTGTVHMWAEDNGDIVLYYYPGDEWAENIVFYKPSHYEVISINKENVFDYFEFRDTWAESRNAFGELTSVTIVTYFVPKEPYYSRISEQLMDDGSDQNVIENGAIEWNFLRSGLDVVVNLEDQTYTFENFEAGTEDTKTYVAGFGDYSGNMGFWARRLELVPDEEGRQTYTWGCTYDMEILRLKLDLYLIAD